MSDRIRDGYDLRPSPEMCAAQVRIHQLPEHQDGLRVAGRFMPHATIKGFFKSSAPQEDIRARASTITQGVSAFPVWNNGTIEMGNYGIVNSIKNDLGGARNLPLQRLHERTLDALLPLVDGDCNFTPGERNGAQFHAHLTLGMADVEPRFFAEIMAFCQELAQVGPAMFRAERLHLYAFESDDWLGDWWATLTWTLLDSRSLG